MAKRKQQNRKWLSEDNELILQSLYEISQAIRQFSHHQNKLLEIIENWPVPGFVDGRLS